MHLAYDEIKANMEKAPPEKRWSFSKSVSFISGFEMLIKRFAVLDKHFTS